VEVKKKGAQRCLDGPDNGLPAASAAARAMTKKLTAYCMTGLLMVLVPDRPVMPLNWAVGDAAVQSVSGQALYVTIGWICGLLSDRPAPAGRTAPTSRIHSA
jgi:hypothetical protein